MIAHLSLWFCLAVAPSWAHGVDEDGDGWIDEVDCDDADPERYPGAEEICDDVDNDCDDEIDEAPCDEGCGAVAESALLVPALWIWPVWTRRRLDSPT